MALPLKTMDARTKIAEQIGQLIIANIEQAAHIDALQTQIKELGQKLHDAAADKTEPQGAAPPGL